jgi:hypothetical protein
MCDVIHTPAWDKCRRLVVDEIDRCRADLAPLEAGDIRAGECLTGGPWRDVTPALIAAHKRNLAALQTILDTLQ